MWCNQKKATWSNQHTEREKKKKKTVNDNLGNDTPLSPQLQKNFSDIYELFIYDNYSR